MKSGCIPEASERDCGRISILNDRWSPGLDVFSHNMVVVCLFCCSSVLEYTGSNCLIVDALDESPRIRRQFVTIVGHVVLQKYKQWIAPWGDVDMCVCDEVGCSGR